ncbi:MAG: putative toxin-antitoxin system toxin component, PIN family [Candidatus Altiarchaeales archaeon WOR_SM1_86-2]|nr:MAG: putative toxin-antitoxin system toxin component, PIN family [Candidatus Altiarchaeales archaeon WOR_SM1_86-2]ODS40906.1 MAG: putative toxin-antitoxin system toxin component, PIN family [Candidatus Altiarchaeales archaeon WOR_SM1_79]
MRITVDTNTLISALGWKDSNEWHLIQKCIQGDTKLVLSESIIEEFTGVIHREKFNFIPAKKKKEFIENLTEISDVVEPVEKVNVIKDDPDDNKILECALCAGVDYIISGDHHLLDMEEYRGIKIVRTRRMLGLLK